MITVLQLRAIRMRIDGSDLERSLEHQHDQCIRDRAALYEEVLDLRQRLARTEELLSPRPRSPGFVFAIAIPARMYAAADPIVGPAFAALAKALQVVKP